MSLDHNIAIMVRETVAGNACVSATRRKRGATVSASVLRSMPGDPHLPSGPFPLPHGEKKGKDGVRGEPRFPNPSRAAPGAACSAAGTCGGWRNRTLAPQSSGCPGTVLPNKKPGFLIMLSERFPDRPQPVQKRAAFRSDGSLRSDPRCLADHTRHHTVGRLSTRPYPVCDMASSAGGLGNRPYKAGTGVIGETNRGWTAHRWDRKQYISVRAVGELRISPFLSSHYLYRER